MAKKKSLKAKLAKKAARSAAESPRQNAGTSSSAEPKPGTSTGNVEQTSKEKKLLGPSISSIKNRPQLRRDPAVSKKAKKYIKDPRLIPRIMEHLETHKNKNFVSIPLIAEELQKKYPEYARKKKSAFMQYVDRAYCIIADPGDSDDSDLDTSDDSNDEGFFPEEVRQLVLKEKERKRKIKEAVKKAVNEGKLGSTAELTVPDVDDMPDDETYVKYQDTNAINNMMSNMYRFNNKRTDEEPPTKQHCVEEKKFVEKIMYPSPDVLRKLKNKDPMAHEDGHATVYTTITTERYYIDKTGTSTSSDTSTTTTVTSVTSATKDSRESNIQKFLGNLPSRVAVKPAPVVQAPHSRERSVPPTVHHPIPDHKLMVPPPQPSPTQEQRRMAARQKYLERQARHQQAANGSARDFSGTPSRQKTRGYGVNPRQKATGPEVQMSSIKFADVGGIEDKLKEICKLLVHMRHPEVYRQLGVTPPRGFLLHGPPGCGKTLLANAIAGELELPFIKIAATEIVSGLSGDSEEKIRGLFDTAVENAPCIVFIDEIDSITPKRETASKDMERRIVSQLLACLDDLNNETAHVLVIGATNRPDSLDPGLRRAGRFDREISLGIPDEQSRMKILQVLCRDLRMIPEFDFRYLAHNTPGFVGADLMALTREAAITAVNRVFHELQGTCVSSVPQSTEQERSDLPGLGQNNCGQSHSLRQSEKSSKCGTVTVSQSNGNIDSSENLYTWTQEQHRKDKKLNGKDVTQPNRSIKDSNSDLNKEKLSGDDTGSRNGIDKSNILLEDSNRRPANNVIYENSAKKSIGNSNYEDATKSAPDQIIHVDITRKSHAPDIGEKELLSVLSWLKEHPPLTEDQLQDLFISLEDFKEALKHVQPSAKREGFATIPDVTWNDIGALHEVREELQLAILAPVRHAEEFKRLGLNRAQGVLLAGPPGCGKTLLAKAVANESGINFISVKGPELLNMYVGESEKAVRTVFQRARNSAPCVIFFDELDALCPRRSDSGEN